MISLKIQFTPLAGNGIILFKNVLISPENTYCFLCGIF